MYDILKKPILSEKSNFLESKYKYTFIVQCTANKKMIRNTIKSIFKITTVNINVINIKPKIRKFKGKNGYTKTYKKAIVTSKSKLDYNKII